MHRYRLNAPQVALQILDGEAVLIHFDTGAYYAVGGAGAAILDALCAGSPLEEIAAAHPDAFGFVARLLVEDLVIAEPNTPTLAATPGGPDLRKFTDLAELLLLDPIHELGDDGWPMA